MRHNEQKFLVVLDTMWGYRRGLAPHWFRINPKNHSGARIYRLTNARIENVWVTNACREMVPDASMHGTADTVWLHQSLEHIPAGFAHAPLLVMGRVAERTYRNMSLDIGRGAHTGSVVFLMHPAARTWTATQLVAVSKRLRRLANKTTLP